MLANTPDGEEADVGGVQQSHKEGDDDEHDDRRFDSLRRTGFTHMGHQPVRVDRKTGKVADGPAWVPDIQAYPVEKLVDGIFRVWVVV